MSLYRQVLLDSPVGYWPLDDVASPLKDISGNGRNATLFSGSGTFRQTGFAGLVSLDVHAGRWTIPTWQVNQSHYAIEMWAKWTGSTSASDRGLFGAFGGAASTGAFFWWNANVVQVWHGSTNISFASAPSTTGFDHFVMSWDGAHLFLYKNNVQVSSTSLSTAPGTSDQVAQISGYGNTSTTTREFPGWLAHLAAYDTALSASRVACHYQAGLRSGVSIG